MRDVRRETRWLGRFIVPFLVVAAIILLGFPTETARLFAWEIKPPMTAMMLGATYLGGVWFFLRAGRASRWHEMAIGFPAVAVFAGLLGIATFLHWDRFIHDSPAFWTWTVLYVVAPPLILLAWLRQGARPAMPVRGDLVLPRAARTFFGLVGIAMIVVSAALFAAPVEVGAAWPWTLTPLTTRVMSAMFALPGLVGIGIALDPRWAAARIVLEAEVIAIAMILVSAARDLGSFDAASPLTATFIGGIATLAIAIVALYAAMERRTPAGGPAADDEARGAAAPA